MPRSPSQCTCFLKDNRERAEGDHRSVSGNLQPSFGRLSASKASAAWQRKPSQDSMRTLCVAPPPI